MNRHPKTGPIVAARRALATLDESSTEAELQRAEQLIARGLSYAESQIKTLPTRARYLRDAITELSSMQRTIARTWKPAAGAAPVCSQPWGVS